MLSASKVTYGMTESQNINELVKGLGAKRAELADLGARIKKSGTPLAILFIDLADSASIKETQSDEDWLGFIFEFLETLSNAVAGAGGTIIKRIGDELLITFESTEACESFIDSLTADLDFQRRYPYKIAVDYGTVYHFRFAEGLTDDPYGRPVDRCARLAKAARPESILCSADYRKHVSNRRYTALGTFTLKGFSEPQEVFLRTWTQRVDSKEYLHPILEHLNRDADSLSGFRYVLRKHSPEDFKFTSSHSGRPFLLRELVNLPCLPYSLKDFYGLLKRIEQPERQKYIGYIINWSVCFDSYTQGSTLIFHLLYEENHSSLSVFVASTSIAL